MVQRFAKKPISEGFDLWDRDYPLGALRFFIFKSETVLPFQLAPCLDAIGEISLQMGGLDDSREQFALAMEKYKILSQPILSDLMRIKVVELDDGAEAAMTQLTELLDRSDVTRSGGEAKVDIKTRSGLARCYAYMAELLLSRASETSDEGDAGTPAAVEGDEEEADVVHNASAKTSAQRQMTLQKAIDAAQMAISLGWDRVHVGYGLLGDAYMALADLESAYEAYKNALQRSANYVLVLEKQIDVVKRMTALHNKGDDAEKVRALETETLALLDRSIEAHPRADVIREKAFLLSELDSDAAALEFLEQHINSPPLQETESTDSVSGNTIAILSKAKAAILADGGNFPAALEAAQAAVKAEPHDDETTALIEDIKSSMQK